MKIYQNGQIKYKKDIRSEQSIQQIYFTAPQIGRLINETAVTVRYWALEFEVYRKNWGNKWHYQRSSVAMFHRIKYLLRTEQFTIAGAKLKLKNNVQIY